MEHECWLCGRNGCRAPLDKHHIFGGTGGRVSGGTGTSGDGSAYQSMFNAGLKSEGQAYEWLLNNGRKSTDASRMAKYYVGMLENGEFEAPEEGGNEDDGAGNEGYGLFYHDIYQKAKSMYDRGKTQGEIVSYLDQFNNAQITRNGMASILRRLGF